MTPADPEIAKAARTIADPNEADAKRVVPNGHYIAANGVIEPATRETHVAASMAGRIARTPVAEGEFVETGAVLAVIENGVELARLQGSEADVALARAEFRRVANGQRIEEIDAAQAEAEAARARADQSARYAERVQELAKTDSATQDDLDRARQQAKTELHTYQALAARHAMAKRGSRADDIAVALAKVHAAEARRDEARAALDRTTVHAPGPGKVLQLKVHIGEYYNPASGTPIVILGDTRALRARLDVDERDVARVRSNAKAIVTTDGLRWERFTGRVVEIGQRMGRKNLRSDDPVERIDTKILEVVLQLDGAPQLPIGLRVTTYVEAVE